jgi:hypothetical protein
MSPGAWYRDRPARRFIALAFAPWFLGLSLAWEIAHTRFYTIWTEASPAYLAYSIAHCTIGDLLIGLVSLALALTMLREGRLHAWRLVPVAVLATGLGTAYTIFSEWMNVRLESWTYAASMPTIPLGGFELGVTPLLQWLVLPGLALALARGLRSRHSTQGEATR